MHVYAPLAQAGFRARAAHSAVGEGQASALPGSLCLVGGQTHTHHSKAGAHCRDGRPPWSGGLS